MLTIPEQDEWVYSDGQSTTCVAFILAMYKEAGVFGPISNSIQVTEFTVGTSLPLFNRLISQITSILLWSQGFLTACRLEMLTCSKFSKIIRHASQVGATVETIRSLSARFLANIKWNCLSTTHWTLMPTWMRIVLLYLHTMSGPDVAESGLNLCIGVSHEIYLCCCLLNMYQVI